MQDIRHLPQRRYIQATICPSLRPRAGDDSRAEMGAIGFRGVGAGGECPGLRRDGSKACRLRRAQNYASRESAAPA
jgi:hypothetical protein